MCTCRGLEQALDHYAQPSAAAPASEAAGAADEKGREARRSLMREKRKKALKHLTVAERDVLTVLSAVCKVSHCTACHCRRHRCMCCAVCCTSGCCSSKVAPAVLWSVLRGTRSLSFIELVLAALSTISALAAGRRASVSFYPGSAWRVM